MIHISLASTMFLQSFLDHLYTLQILMQRIQRYYIVSMLSPYVGSVIPKCERVVDERNQRLFVSYVLTLKRYYIQKDALLRCVVSVMRKIGVTVGMLFILCLLIIIQREKDVRLTPVWWVCRCILNIYTIMVKHNSTIKIVIVSVVLWA